MNTPVPNCNPLHDGGGGCVCVCGGGGATPRTSHSPVASTNVRISHQNFLTLRFNTFSALVLNVKYISGGSSKLLNLNQEQHLKKYIFLVKSL